MHQFASICLYLRMFASVFILKHVFVSLLSYNLHTVLFIFASNYFVYEFLNTVGLSEFVKKREEVKTVGQQTSRETSKQATSEQEGVFPKIAF